MNSSPEGPQMNFELPRPPSPEDGEQGAEQAVEAPASRPETAGKQPAQPVALPPLPDDIPAAGLPPAAAPAPDPAAAVSASSHGAGDSDRIEQVWVHKVKDVVARTHDDPHIQSNEMSKIKADYNLKRFNKQVKTDEAAA